MPSPNIVLVQQPPARHDSAHRATRSPRRCSRRARSIPLVTSTVTRPVAAGASLASRASRSGRTDDQRVLEHRRPGLVIASNPAAGSLVTSGQVDQLDVSTGSATSAVPKRGRGHRGASEHGLTGQGLSAVVFSLTLHRDVLAGAVADGVSRRRSARVVPYARPSPSDGVRSSTRSRPRRRRPPRRPALERRYSIVSHGETGREDRIRRSRWGATSPPKCAAWSPRAARASTTTVRAGSAC